MDCKQKKIAIVVQGFAYGGGVPAMAKFLYYTIHRSDRYEPSIISLAMAANDQASVRLLAPTTWRQGIQQREERWSDLPFTHIGTFLSELEFQRYAPRASLTKMLNGFDLIQIVSGAPPIAYAMRYVQRPKCIFVATRVSHDLKSHLAKKHGVAKLYLSLMIKMGTRLEQIALPAMSHIFCESDYTKELLDGLVVSNKLSLGVPGVNVKLFHPSATYQEDSYILAVGRFADPRKNIKLLLQAYQILYSRSYPMPKLVVAGHDGLSQEDWLFAETLGIASAIEVHKDLTLEKLAELYRNASLFVLSSDEEGLGIVILEAMASGIPVISTDCGGPKTAVVEGKTGLLTPVGDASMLASKMKILLENVALRRQMGQTARHLAEERFSIEAAGKVYLNKYDELLGLAH